MTKGENAARMLEQAGVLAPGREGIAEALLEDLMQGDYILGGRQVNQVANLRPSPGGFRCCLPIGDDIQSGPIFCGDPATMVADPLDKDGKPVPNAIVATCKNHEWSLKRLVKNGS